MVSIKLNQILDKITLKVLKEIATSDSTYRDKKKKLGIDLNTIYYHVAKLIKFGLIKKTNGKLKNLVKCPYCEKTNICQNNSYPEGCFLDNELTK